MSRELHALTAIDLIKGYQQCVFSPLEATEAILGRIASLNERFNCFCYVDEDGARAAARESAARYERGEVIGPLDGVPVSVKDLLYTRGMPTLHGSRTVDAAGPWEVDAPAVARLREAGAVLLGKTTTPEFGHKGTTDSLRHGITRNPWDDSRTPGGSSGGSSSALAAGMGPLAIGTDAGGSIRKPANFAGVVGFKPSWSLVPVWPHGAGWPLSCTGPMARSVADAATFLNVIVRPDSRDPFSGRSAPNYLAEVPASLTGLRIAYSRTLGFTGARTEVLAVTDRAADLFRSLGAEVVEADPEISEPFAIFNTLFSVGAANSVSKLRPDQVALLEDSYRAMAERGAQTPLLDYRRALEKRALLAEKLGAFHESYDLLICPVNPVTAYYIGQPDPDPRDGDRFGSTIDYTVPFNVTGQPGLVVPVGLADDGLPVAIQIVGPYGADDLVLRAGAAFEQTTGWNGRLAV